MKGRAIVILSDVENARHVTLKVHTILKMATSEGESSINFEDNSYFDDDLDEFLQTVEEDDYLEESSEEICANVSISKLYLNIILFF